MIRFFKRLFSLLLIGLPIFLLNFSSASQVFDVLQPAIVQDRLNSSVFILQPQDNFTTDDVKVFQYYGVGNYPRLATLFRSNTGLYLIKSCAGGFACTDINTAIRSQGFFTKFQLCTSGSCTSSPVSQFLSDTRFHNVSSFSFHSNDGGQDVQFCFINDSLNVSACFYQNDPEEDYESSRVLTGSLGFTVNPFVADIPGNFLLYSSITNSPFTTYVNSSGGNNVDIGTGSSGVDDYNYSSNNTGVVVIYYEDQYKFKKEICFVGTTDLSGNFEDRLTYYPGTGYTIFDTYSKLYNKTSFSLEELSSFINSWVYNFDSWFRGANRDINGDVSKNMVYNGNGTVSLDYGPGLTNPFLGNKVVYYFLSSTIRDSSSSYLSSFESVGGDVAYYCYKKLFDSTTNPGGTNISGNTGYDITYGSDFSISYDYNASVYARNNLYLDVQFSGSDTIISQSWVGTPLYEFTGGEEFTDFTSYFSSSFNRFKNVFQGLDISDLALGQLPSYIVVFLLAIIFFRFLSH